MTYISLLDLSNHARAAAADADIVTRDEAVAAIDARLRMPRRCIEAELRGRKPVDAALNLALAGAQDPWLFSELTEHATSEVRKWGRRRSCTSVTLAQLGERAAAAGCRSPLGLFDLLGEILSERAESGFMDVASALRSGNFSLATSEAAARWVFRASARLTKQASASAEGLFDTDWGSSASEERLDALFGDPSRPLTIDLGCGFGCGPLVYASSAAWAGDNVLGCDLSGAGVAFARGVSARWGATDHCHFVRADVRAVLRAARRYPGGCHRVILSCPTPYAQLQQQADADVDSDVDSASSRKNAAVGEPAAAPTAPIPPTLASGNAQLPTTVADPSFLGHADIFAEIAEILAPGGQLFLASNVEDVALTLLRNARANDLEPAANGAGGTSGAGGTGGAALAASITLPRRQQLWRAAGGEHADGAIWQASRSMPWASETERTHQLEGRPVHRAVLYKRG